MLAIFGGVVSAGAIMTALTLAGKAGAAAAMAVLALFCLSRISGVYFKPGSGGDKGTAIGA